MTTQPMTTLHIRVHVNDVQAWRAGYAEHEEARRRAGVRHEAVRHEAGDESRLVIDLDFDTPDAAEAYLDYLSEQVWKDQPILASPPQASILEPLALV